jgi:ABC-type transport system involved in cytochrome c biogenesis permease subunit
MQEMGVFWLRVAAGLYSIGLLHALLMILRKRAEIFRAALAAFALGAVLHVVATVEFTMALGHLPVNNFNESSSLCALLIAISFLFVYARYQFASLSVFIFPLVFVMTLIGAMETPVASWPNSSLRDAWLLVHVVMVLLGYAALLLTAAACIFYLVRERQLKRKQQGVVFDRLPPLAAIDTVINHSMGFGFVFITLGVVAGSAWAFIESGTAWIGDPKIGIALVTWAFYLLMVFLRTSAGWRGRKAALMALVVLGCSALTWAAHIGLRPLLAR